AAFIEDAQRRRWSTQHCVILRNTTTSTILPTACRVLLSCQVHDRIRVRYRTTSTKVPHSTGRACRLRRHSLLCSVEKNRTKSSRLAIESTMQDPAGVCQELQCTPKRQKPRLRQAPM
ncbi:hypothetical protein SPRG_20233, partial [Saprolegnia parasitica CBS 223.65]